MTGANSVSFVLAYPSATRRLLIAPSQTGDQGYVYLVLPADSPTDAVTLTDALNDVKLAANFVISAADPGIAEDQATSFVQQILALTPGGRSMIWLAQPRAISATTVALLGLSTDGSSIRTPLSGAKVSSDVALSIPAQMKVTTDGQSISLSGNIVTPVTFTNVNSSDVSKASIPFTGPTRGAVTFAMAIRRDSLFSPMQWGFQFLIPVKTATQPVIAEWLPLADDTEPSSIDMLGFQVSFDPSDIFNEAGLTIDRTALRFTGKNQAGDDTVLYSYFRTIFGAKVLFRPLVDGDVEPARLSFARGETRQGSQSARLGPAGDFGLWLEQDTDQAADLMCGLHGTESLRFGPWTKAQSGDVVRFRAGMPAYAPVFPFPDSTPLGPPADPDAALLDDTYTTSWAWLRPQPSAEAVAYVAQPKGAALFGHDSFIANKYASLLGHRSVPVGVGDVEHWFPVAPYAGVQPGDGISGFSAAQIEEVERTIISPTRRDAIGAQQNLAAKLRPAALEGARVGAADRVTSPAGLLVDLDGSRWVRALLGQNLDNGRQMYFCNLEPALQQALQTNDLMLVAVNGAALGELVATGDGSCGGGPAFHNSMNIGGWEMLANVGVEQTYGDYSNVMIIKGRRGALYDPSTSQTLRDSLVVSVDKWTQRSQFSSPVTDPNQGPDSSQQVLVSQWLQDYFAAAAAQADNPYFARFNRIAADPDWAGILILRMKIGQPPDDLAGIVAGIADPASFNVHHLAIEITPIQNDGAQLSANESSSIYGLIYYEDPNYRAPPAGQRPQPVPPGGGIEYGFRLLSLKVLFENTSIRDFESYAQLTLNQLFGMPVTNMGGDGGNAFNSLILTGAYQNNDGVPSYSLSSADYTYFEFANNLFNRIELSGAQMSNRDPAANGGAVTWFGLQGRLDFAVIDTVAGVPFDLLSYGNAPGQTTPGQGLSFSNLGLRMVGDSFATQSFAFVVDEMSFDTARSTPRSSSIVRQFALNLRGLSSGTEQHGPEESGYLTVITDARATGVKGRPWYGLSYRLNLGTPGELAGRVSLDSTLLMAWAPDSDVDGSYRLFVGLELPGTSGGAKLISLQNVLRLSIGQIRLTQYEQDEARHFMLMLTEIALKFLGLLKIPPSGSTLFYLFGNPAGAGDPSGLGWYALYRQPQQGA